MQRFVIFPDEIHVSRSMRKLMRKGRYSVSINRDFHNVIRLCGELRHDEEGAWLGSDMIDAYEELHRQGFAASVEVWEGERLVGGIYGVNIGSCFFLTSSLRTPKFFVKEFCYFLMSCHQHCLGINLLVQR